MVLNMKYYQKYMNYLNKNNDCIFCQNNTDKIFITIREDSEYNYEFVKQNSIIQPLYTYHSGGVIVAKPKDLALTLITNDALKIKKIVDQVVSFIKSKTTKEVYFDNNDIMVENKKIFSWMQVNFRDLIYGGFYLSFDTDEELIKQICIKPMKKEPVGLSALGISPDEVIEFLENLIQEEGLNIVERLEEDN